jgi:hypothetical protein
VRGDGNTDDCPLTGTEEKIMEANQQRVVDEKLALSDKLDKLETFHNTVIYAGLPPAEQSRLTRQLYIMKLYEQVLAERISAFATPAP